MANLFGVTAQGVFDRHLPRFPALGASSKPTTTAASAIVDQVAGVLRVHLRRAGADPDEIINSGATVDAYYWCQRAVDAGVLCLLGKAGIMQSVQEGVRDACQEWDDLLAQLDSDPASVLTGVVDDTDLSTFGSIYSDNDTDASSTDPKARVDDDL
jgi:hypothetical protein